MAEELPFAAGFGDGGKDKDLGVAEHGSRPAKVVLCPHGHPSRKDRGLLEPLRSSLGWNVLRRYHGARRAAHRSVLPGLVVLGPPAAPHPPPWSSTQGASFLSLGRPYLPADPNSKMSVVYFDPGTLPRLVLLLLLMSRSLPTAAVAGNAGDTPGVMSALLQIDVSRIARGFNTCGCQWRGWIEIFMGCIFTVRFGPHNTIQPTVPQRTVPWKTWEKR